MRSFSITAFGFGVHGICCVARLTWLDRYEILCRGFAALGASVGKTNDGR